MANKKKKTGAKPSQLKPKWNLPAWGWYALCFVLPALTLTVVYAWEGFYPFGEKSILVSDMAQQYVEFFCGLKKGDVFFSWSKALGTSYIGVFSYYVSSPLSLLTLLVPNEAMPLGLMVLTILKLGLAGLSYGIFARYYFERLDLCCVLGAIAYALCAYAVGYSVCIMWLDGLIWLPIILLGLERLLDGTGRWLFPLSLAACFLSTWYISYMIGGFCLLWFLFRVVVKGMDVKMALRRGREFLLGALWALCLTAWLWLPSFLAMTTGKLSTAQIDYEGLFNFDLWTLAPQFLFGHHQFFAVPLPYVFCGTLTLCAAVAYFFLRSVPLRQRLAAGAFALVMVASLWLSPLDKVWHLFKYPNWFPYRYAFLLSFLLVFLAQHTLNRVKDAWPPLSHPAALALAVLLCWEMGANARVIFQTINGTEAYTTYAAYTADYAANARLVERAEEEAPEGAFYRMGSTHDRGCNAPLSFGYNGITHYSSIYNARVNGTLRSLGLAQSWYWCAYYGSSQVTDALLDIRYVLTDREIPGYREVAEVDGLGLWENPNTLPLAFLGRGRVDATSGAPVERQNQVFSAITGDGGAVFSPIQPQMDLHEDWVSLTYTGTGAPIYLDLTDAAVRDLQRDGQSLFRYTPDTGKTRGLYCAGAPGAGEELTVVVTHDGSWSPEGRSFTCDLDRLAQGVAGLNNTEVTVSGSRVDVAVEADGEGPLLTTIPAEEGWSVAVDGKAAELGSWLDDTFLALDLSAGSHSVTLRYTAPGLRPGLALGALALAGAGVQVYLPRKRKKEDKA